MAINYFMIQTSDFAELPTVNEERSGLERAVTNSTLYSIDTTVVQSRLVG